MTQTRTMSFIEAWSGVVVGFGINYVLNLTLLPLWFGATVTPSGAFGLGLVYTLVSLARTYGLRRAFNWWGLRQYTAGPCPAPAPASPSPVASTETPAGTPSRSA